MDTGGSTSPATSSTNGPNGGGVGSDTTARGAYSGGGRGVANKNGNSGLGLSFGGGGGKGDDGKSNSMDFGATSDGKAVSIDDPEDYFTRIGIEENIFKIIHKRYESVALSWLKESINEIDASKIKKTRLK